MNLTGWTPLPVPRGATLTCLLALVACVLLGHPPAPGPRVVLTTAGATAGALAGPVSLGLPVADPRCTRDRQPARWDAQLDRALDLAGVPPAERPGGAAPRWFVLPPGDSAALGAFGRTALAGDRTDDRTPGRVVLSALTPCAVLASLVVHERAHQRQAAAGLTRAAYDRDPLRYERAADCATYAAVRTGFRYLPYLDASGVPPGRACDHAAGDALD